MQPTRIASLPIGILIGNILAKLAAGPTFFYDRFPFHGADLKMAVSACQEYHKPHKKHFQPSFLGETVVRFYDIIHTGVCFEKKALRGEHIT